MTVEIFVILLQHQTMVNTTYFNGVLKMIFRFVGKRGKIRIMVLC